jgi:hypothetical protein
MRSESIYIEGGWPGSNPRDKEFFIRLQHHGSEAWFRDIRIRRLGGN